MRKNVKKTTVGKVLPVGVPEWVAETMEEMNYGLEIMCGCGECTTETVDLTRDEYITLKQHLAKMRGIKIPKDLKVPKAA